MATAVHEGSCSLLEWTSLETRLFIREIKPEETFELVSDTVTVAEAVGQKAARVVRLGSVNRKGLA